MQEQKPILFGATEISISNKEKIKELCKVIYDKIEANQIFDVLNDLSRLRNEINSIHLSTRELSEEELSNLKCKMPYMNK